MSTEAPASEELAERLGRLTDELEQIEDPAARRTAEALVGAMLDLYGEGLERILAIVDEGGEHAVSIRQALADDGTVGSLLLIHGLYPVDLETRVLEALDSVRPYMESHGGDVELLGLEDGVAHLELKGSCDGCPASSATLELAIKGALAEAAPDLLGFEVEGVTEPPAPATPEITGTPLPLMNGGGPAVDAVEPAEPSAAEWFELTDAGWIEQGAMAPMRAGGNELIVANVGGNLLAYRSLCPGCGGSLAGSKLDGVVVSCPSCSRGFDLPRVGRALGDEALQLDPVPLLKERGTVRVAITR